MSEQTDRESKGGRGHLAGKHMPGLIPDTSENIMRAVPNKAPKNEDEWRYLKPNRGRK